MKTIVPAGRVDRLAVDRERRAAADDDVHLLVPERALVVLLDDLLPTASAV
jgi:hypothetical protein